MSEPIRLHYQCHFCGMQTSKDLQSGPPNPGVCNKSPKVDGFHTHHKWSSSRSVPLSAEYSHFVCLILFQKTKPSDARRRVLLFC